MITYNLRLKIVLRITTVLRKKKTSWMNLKLFLFIYFFFLLVLILCLKFSGKIKTSNWRTYPGDGTWRRSRTGPLGRPDSGRTEPGSRCELERSFYSTTENKKNPNIIYHSINIYSLKNRTRVCKSYVRCNTRVDSL